MEIMGAKWYFTNPKDASLRSNRSSILRKGDFTYK